MNELKKIYEEFPVELDFDTWLQMFKHAVEEDHSFLYLNLFKPRGQRCYKRFESMLIYDENDAQHENRGEEGDLEGHKIEKRKNKRLRSSEK